MSSSLLIYGGAGVRVKGVLSWIEFLRLGFQLMGFGVYGLGLSRFFEVVAPYLCKHRRINLGKNFSCCLRGDHDIKILSNCS